MSVTILYKEQPPFPVMATPDGDDLWLTLDDLRSATGWEIRPEGVCREGQCVPIPEGREREFVRESPARFNLAALARWLEQPVLHDDVHGVWFFGEAAQVRREALRSLHAPDFRLPDLEGRMQHSGLRRVRPEWPLRGPHSVLFPEQAAHARSLAILSRARRCVPACSATHSRRRPQVPDLY